MKKAMLSIFLIIGVILWQAVLLYVHVQADKEEGVTSLIQIVQQETDASIVDVTRFHGEELYHVFTVYHSEQDEYSYIFVNENQHLMQIPFSAIATSQEVATAKAVEKFPEIIEISRVIPAYVNNQFVWEIIGYDQQDGLHYIYYTMTEGAFLKRFTVDFLTK